jgi:hypothetical protein
LINNAAHKQPGSKQLRSFAIITFLGFLLLAFAGWRKGSLTLAVLFFCFSILIVLGLIYQPLLVRLYRWWMGLSEILGWISSRLILVLIFYIVFTPIGLLLRLLDKPLLDTRFPDDRTSFWQKRSKGQSNLEKMY